MRPCFLPIAISAALAAIAFAQSQPPLQLEPEKTFNRSLVAGGSDLFALDLKTDQIARLTLEGQGQDVILSVYSPDGRLSRAFLSEPRKGGAALQFLATQPGRWTLKIAAREGNSPAAYRISDLKINTPHPPALAEEDISPRIRKITSQAEADVFWKEIGPNGSPLIEPIPDDPINRFTTFLWRGDADTQRVLLNFYNCSPIPGDCFLRHVEGTDVWYRTMRLDHRLRTTYLLTPNAPAVPPGTKIDDDLLSQVAVRSLRDPLNPRATWDSPKNPDLPLHRGSSLLEMPDAPPQPWAAKRAGVPAGEIVKQDFSSALLKNTRPIFVYLPPGYSKNAQPHNLLVVFDGDTYIDVVPTPTTLDNLISEKRIAPTVAVMVGNVDGMRGTELPCNATFAEFLNSELMPWLRRNYNVTRDPRRVTIGGSSYGGLAATCAAYRHPETFGSVLSQSGSYWWTPPPDPSKPDSFAPKAEANYVARLFIDSPKLPLRFYLDAGSLEWDRDVDGPSILVTNRHLRDVLRARGYEVFYQEFQGAHDYQSWRGTIADGLILLGGKSTGQTQPGSAKMPPRN